MKIKASVNLLFLMVLMGCSVHRPLDLEEFYASAPSAYLQEKEGSPVLCPWWEEFQDSGLTESVEEAINNNFDIKEAEYLFIKGLAEAFIAGSLKLPEVNLTEGLYFGASFIKSKAGGSGLFALPQVSYEVDIWKKIDSKYQSKALSAHEAFAHIDEVNLIVAGTASDLWFTILEQNALKKVIEDQIRSSGLLLEMMHKRFHCGASSALDVIQQELQYEATKASLIPVQESLYVSVYKLSILSGKPPESPVCCYPDIKATLLPPFPCMGSPIDLFRTRPDLRTIANEVMALDFDVAAAIADIYPALTTPISCRFRLENLTKSLHACLFETALNLMTPLFDGGKRKNEVLKRRALLYAGLETLSQRFLEALGEVETFIVKENALIALTEENNKRLSLSKISLALAKESYGMGLEDYLTVIHAESTLQTLEKRSISLHKNLLANRALLYRALGSAPK